MIKSRVHLIAAIFCVQGTHSAQNVCWSTISGSYCFLNAATLNFHKVDIPYICSLIWTNEVRIAQLGQKMVHVPLFPSFLLKANRGLMSILGFYGICILGRVYWVVLTGSQDILFPIWGCSLLKSNSHFLATSLFRWFRSFCMAASNELRSFENWISLLPGFILLVFYSKGRSWFD